MFLNSFFSNHRYVNPILFNHDSYNKSIFFESSSVKLVCNLTILNPIFFENLTYNNKFLSSVGSHQEKVILSNQLLKNSAIFKIVLSFSEPRKSFVYKSGLQKKQFKLQTLFRIRSMFFILFFPKSITSI
jgi:hypothetical protein